MKSWVIKDKNEILLSNKIDILNRWAEFYSELYYEEDSSNIPLYSTEDRIPPIMIDEVQFALKQLKKNKACGPDGIKAELLTNGGPILEAAILHLSIQ